VRLLEWLLYLPAGRRNSVIKAATKIASLAGMDRLAALEIIYSKLGERANNYPVIAAKVK
jgi:hypothetical protein